METVLVTGANGLIGHNILKHLQNRGYRLVGTSLSPQTFDSIECEYESADISDKSQLLYVLSKYSPSIIIHCAALSKPDDCEKDTISCWRLNVETVENIANYCSFNDVYLIHFSSDFVFSGIEGVYNETASPNPISTYGRSKWESEKVVQQIHNNYSIIRTSLVYGTVEGNSKSNLVLWVKRNLQEETPIKVVADQYRTPTYVKDIAEAVYKMITQKSFGIFNIAGKEILSVYDIALEAARIFEMDHSLITPVATISLNEPAKRPPKTHLLCERAFNELAYIPHFLSDGLLNLKKDYDSNS